MSPINASPISAVIFDLDGTLLDTIEDIAEASNRIYGSRGVAPFSIAEMKTLVGEGARELVRKAFASRGRPVPSDDEMTAIIKDYRVEYERLWRAHSRPYPGVPELLAELSRRGVRTAVLSNKDQTFTAAMIGELLPGHRFDVVRGSRPGTPLKPDPAPALAVAADLALPPASCALAGDTSIDMRTARAAGMFAVGALWGFRTREELLASGADVLLASPAELLSLLTSRTPRG
jgi:phosphoglycolate phosphatase